MIIQQSTLYYQEGTSDKVYKAWVEEEKSSNSFVVNFAFGRRGSTMQTGTKTQRPTSKAQALSVYSKLVDSKLAKGYEEGCPSSDYRVETLEKLTSDKKKAPKILPQLLTPIEDKNELTELLSDHNWVAQQKLDGRRMIIEVCLTTTQNKSQNKSQNKATAFNRRGLPCGAPEAALQEAELLSKTLNKSITLDGESLGDKLHVFDILKYEEDTTHLTYNSRLEILEKVFQTFHGKLRSLQLVPTFRSTSEKKKLLAELKTNNAEGIVLKEVNSPYQAGRPNSKGNHRKFKFVDSLSAIITKVNDKRSVGLGVYSLKESNPKTNPKTDSKLVGVGNVSIPVNHEVPNEGDIVEIRYLYAIPVSNALYQPVYLGKRNDLDKEDCTIEQLKYKA